MTPDGERGGRGLPELPDLPKGRAAMPQEQMAAAMQMQVELLHKINERQEVIEERVNDTRRSEMMLTSTRALNESFRGMRRIQERLLDELREDEGRGRGKWLLFLGLVVLAGSIAWGIHALASTVEKAGGRIENSFSDASLDSSLSAMEARIVGSLGDKRDEGLRADLEMRLATLRGDIEEIRRERDRAQTREEAARHELLSWKKRTEAAESTARRLTRENLENQSMISELGNTIQKLREAASAAQRAATPVEPGVASAGQDADPATRTEVPPPAGKTNAVPTTVTHQPEPIPAGVPLSGKRLAALNALLGTHRGSETYVLKSVGSVGEKVLEDVVLEIRGRNGTVSRSVTASSLSFEVAGRGDFLEMVFSKGSVAYHQGPGKVISSPFFRNVYKVGVFGISRKEWLQAGFPFVTLK